MSIRTLAMDAILPLYVTIRLEDIKGAVCGSPTDCVFARAIRRITGAERVEVYKNILYVHFKDYSLRYQISEPAKLAAFLFDMTKQFKNSFKRKDKDEPITFTFDTPRPAVSLEHLRSKEFKIARKNSHQKNIAKPTRRKYDKPNPFTVHTLRNGTGRVKDPIISDIKRS